MEAERERIDITQAILIVIASIIGDTVQLLFGVVGFVSFGTTWFFNSAISALMFITFWVWMRALHVPVRSIDARVVARGASVVIETLPLPTSMIPAWTAANIFIIWHVRREDKKHNQEMQERAAQKRSRPANDNVPRSQRKGDLSRTA